MRKIIKQVKEDDVFPLCEIRSPKLSVLHKLIWFKEILEIKGWSSIEGRRLSDLTNHRLTKHLMKDYQISASDFLSSF